MLAEGIAKLEARIVATAKEDPAMQRLCKIPGIGPLTAHAIVAAIGDGRRFDTARDFAAWAGLTPHENSSGGKTTKLGISRQGDLRLRSLFALGASTVMRSARVSEARATPWQRGILARRPVKVAVLAQAARPRGSLGRFWFRARLIGGLQARRFKPPLKPHKGIHEQTLSGLAATPDRRPRKEQMEATAKWSGPGLGNSDTSSRLKSAPQCWEPNPRYPSGPAVMNRVKRPNT